MPNFVLDIRTAVNAAGLENGNRISFHHHLRHGDASLPLVLKTLCKMGFKDLTLCVSSVMGRAGVAVVEAIEKGVISKIETTGMKEPLSSAVMNCKLQNPVIFRSHGGRAEAISSGRTHIDLAFITVSAVDLEGNANGVDGPNRFGSIGYALVDAEYASYKMLITDYISEHRLNHISIPSEKVDSIVKINSIGDKTAITSGTLRSTAGPIETAIAQSAISAIDATSSFRQGLRFQAGSGAISLAASGMIANLMRERKIAGEFALGGATAPLVSLLEEGLISKLYDVQSFDDTAALSLKQNPNHLEISAFEYAAPNNPSCYANKLDLMILSATEVDCNFNINSITGSNACILGALGGAPDTATGARLTVVVIPSFRGRIPTIRERVHTICTPGKSVDIVITERGICVNKLRPDLRASLEKAGIKVMDIHDLMEKIHLITGKPEYPQKGKRIVGLVEYRDGTIIDKLYS